MDTPLTPPSETSAHEGRIRRFALTERLAHWAYAFFFLGALLTGLFMWIPATRVWMAGDRQSFAQHHGAAGFVMVLLPLALFVVFDRRSLKAGLREVDAWSVHDRRWFWAALRGDIFRGRQMPPQGRLNAGQKIYSVVVAAMSLGFVVTGSLLLAKARLPAWLVSRALWLHAALAVAGTVLLAGHLVNVFLTRRGRGSLMAMVRGTYPEDLAREHHRLWWESVTQRGGKGDE
jgi:formate dehydrogenase subunit gamma